MQLGMVGLGRMGANMVRRLMKAGHDCVVFDMSPKAVDELVKEKAVGSSSLEDLVSKLQQAARDLADGSGGVLSTRRSPNIAPHLEAGDILIDGGNSYYIDDIRRAKELATKGIHYVDVGTSGGVWGLERGYCMMIGGRMTAVQASRSDLQDHCSGHRRHSAHARAGEARRHRRAGLSALRRERRRPLREDGAQRNRVRHHGGVRGRAGSAARRQRRASRSTRLMPRPRPCAIRSTTSTTSTCLMSPKCGGGAA